jgi:hypothetical protein
MILDVWSSGNFIFRRKSHINSEIKSKKQNYLGRKIFFETYNCSRKEEIRTEIASFRKKQGIKLL